MKQKLAKIAYWFIGNLRLFGKGANFSPLFVLARYEDVDCVNIFVASEMWLFEHLATKALKHPIDVFRISALTGLKTHSFMVDYDQNLVIVSAFSDVKFKSVPWFIRRYDDTIQQISKRETKILLGWHCMNGYLQIRVDDVKRLLGDNVEKKILTYKNFEDNLK